MQAFVVEKYQKKRALCLAEMPEPIVQDHDILVQIHAAAVNVLDSKLRDGEFKLLLPYRTPFIAGHDVAGVVIQVGKNVQKFKVGDEIYARPRDHRTGTFAEKIAIHEADAAFKPNNISMVEAASLPLVGLTAWQALVEVAQLQAGQKVFIQAGSGGVGTFAIQLAKQLGATVATTASVKNADLVKKLGADIVIDYQTQDFEQILNHYDLVINSQDSKTLEKSLRILKPNGLLISISGPPDPNFAKAFGLNIALQKIMGLLSCKARHLAKKLGVKYAFLFMRAEGNQLAKITQLIESNKIKPVIDRIFPFAQTAEALAYVESGRAKGKVAIQINQTNN